MWLNAAGFSSPHASIPIITLVICLSCLYALGRSLRRAFYGPLAKIPGPRWNAFTIFPLLSHMWVGLEVEYVDKLHKKYGPIVRVAPDFVAVLGTSSTFKQVYGYHPKAKGAWEKDHVFYERPITGVGGPITADTVPHHRQRKILSPAFSDQALVAYEYGLVSWAAKMKDKLQIRASAGTPTDMVRMLNFTTFDIMSDMVFGEPLGMLEDGEYAPWVKLIFGFLKLATRLKALRYLGPWLDTTISFVKHNVPYWVPGWFRIPHEHHRYVARRVDKRLQTVPTHPDIWSLINKESTEEQESFSTNERYSIAGEMMIGGTETTATVLSGVIYYLLKNPKYLKELTQELRSQYDDVHSLTMQSLQNQRTLNAVLWEGLRVYPPLPTGLPRHVPVGGTVLEGYYLPDDARVAIYHKPTYKHEAHFHLPNEFRPERWLGDEEFKDDNLDAVQPFSVGPRNCIGRNFAWHEMRLLLATVLLHFDLKLLPESEGWHKQKVYVVWEKRALMCELIEVTKSG